MLLFLPFKTKIVLISLSFQLLSHFSSTLYSKLLYIFLKFIFPILFLLEPSPISFLPLALQIYHWMNFLYQINNDFLLSNAMDLFNVTSVKDYLTISDSGESRSHFLPTSLSSVDFCDILPVFLTHFWFFLWLASLFSWFISPVYLCSQTWTLNLLPLHTLYSGSLYNHMWFSHFKLPQM